MRRLDKVALGTIDKRTGEPYVSFVPVALTYDASPILLLSNLSEHTINIKSDPRISLLFDATGESDIAPDGGRLTLQGSIAVDDDPNLRRRYLARHPLCRRICRFRRFRDLQRYPAPMPTWLKGLARQGGCAQKMCCWSPVLETVNSLSLRANLWAGKFGPWTLSGLDPDGVDFRNKGRTIRLWTGDPNSRSIGVHQPDRELGKACVKSKQALGKGPDR